MKKVLLLFLLVCITIGAMSGCAAIKQAIETKMEEERELMRGTNDGSIYTSEFAKMTFTVPDGWAYQSDEEISEIMGIGMEMFADEEIISQEQLDTQSLYDMMALNPNTGSSISIIYESLTPYLNGNSIAEDEYLNSAAKTFEDMQTVSYVCSDISEATIAADTYKTFTAELVDYNAIQYYYTRKINKCMISIIISVFGDDDIEDILGHFSAAETAQ